MKRFTEANTILQEFNDLVNNQKLSQHEQCGLRVGVDLGTSSIVLSIVNQKGMPIYGAYEYHKFIKDGLVVDYTGTVAITKRLKEKAEVISGKQLIRAAAAVPPGTIGNNKKVVGHVLESAGFEVTAIFDEPTAAAKVLGLSDGAVIDVGGGTTGITILKNGRVIYTVDEPTGGMHMNLVLSGAYGLSIDEAETFKRDKQHEDDVYSAVKPVIEKMAAISLQALREGNYEPGTPIVIVGGTSNVKFFEETFAQYLKCPVYKPKFPEFVTPLGIALGSE